MGPMGPMGPVGPQGLQGPAGSIAPYEGRYICISESGKKAAIYWGTCASQDLKGIDYWVLATPPK